MKRDKKQPEFRPGDVVQYITPHDQGEIMEVNSGAIGTVVDYDQDDDYEEDDLPWLVSFDDDEPLWMMTKELWRVHEAVDH